MTRKLAAAAALIAVTMSSLVGVTSGCDLSVEDSGIQSDTTTQGSDDAPGTSVFGPEDTPAVP